MIYKQQWDKVVAYLFQTDFCGTGWWFQSGGLQSIMGSVSVAKSRERNKYIVIENNNIYIIYIYVI